MTEFNAGRGRRGRRQARLLRRTRARLRPARHGSVARRRAVRRAFAGARRRARLRPDRQARRCRRPLKPNVFALGDATDLPTSKAGSVTHFEAEVLAENVARFLADEELDAGYDGHANCFIETGFHKALLIDFNYDIEPLPGHFPTVFGPAAPARVPPQPPREARCSSGSTGTRCFRAATFRASGRRCRPQARSAVPGHATEEERDDDDTDRRRSRSTSTPRASSTSPEQWNERIAEAIAAENGIAELTDRHWLVVRFMRERYLDDRHRALDPLARQGIGRPRQGALPAVPQGAGEARRQDRRHPQAQGLHLGRSTR